MGSFASGIVCKIEMNQQRLNSKPLKTARTLTQQQMIVIPTEWYYYINSPKEATAVFYEADTIATWVFNRLRRK